MFKSVLIFLVIGLLAFGECQKGCAGEGQMCEGIAGIQCCGGEGLRCYAKDKTIADWSGKCVKGCRQKGESCGGIAGILCCDVESCYFTENHPDSMGKCI